MSNKVVAVQESMTIPFSLIETDQEFNVRDEKTGYQDIEELTESIRSQGLITPLTVMKNGGETYKLVSGFRRYQALKALKMGDKDVNVVIRQFDSDAQLHLANLVENTARDGVHPADLAKRLAELESGTYCRVLGASHGEEEAEVTVGQKLDRKEISKHTGLTTSHIGNLIRVHTKLSDPVKKMWRKHEIPMSKIFKWASLEEDNQLESFGEWKELQDQEKAEGKKNKPRAAAAEANGNNSNEEESEETTSSGGFNGPSKSEMRSQMQLLEEKFEKLKGSDLEVAKAKHKTLRWVLGEITRL